MGSKWAVGWAAGWWSVVGGWRSEGGWRLVVDGWQSAVGSRRSIVGGRESVVSKRSAVGGWLAISGRSAVRGLVIFAGVRGSPERHMLFLGAGGEGRVWPGQKSSCVAAAVAAAAVAVAVGCAFCQFGDSFGKQPFFHQPGLENSPDGAQATVQLRISLRVSWK